MIRDYFSIAWKNLKKRKLRAWLTMLGIFISIATIFLLISLSLGLQGAIQEQFRQLGSDKFFILPLGQLGPPQGGGAVQLTLEDVRQVEKVSGVKSVSYMTLGNAELVYNNKKRYYLVLGIPLEDQKSVDTIWEAFNLQPSDGELLKKGDIGVISIGSRYNDANLFGKPVELRSKININGVDFKVSGLMKTLGNPGDDQNIYMPYEDFKILFASGDRVDEIIVQVQEGEDIKEIADSVNKKLASFRGVSKQPDFTILTPEELLESFGVILDILTGFLLGVAGISLIVGGLGIANTMYTGVIERTKEIGAMKAIGAKNSDIMWIFVIESGLLGFVGGVVGVLLGMIIGKIVEFIAVSQLGTNLLQVATPLWLIFGCLAFAFFVGAISGLWPALRAAKIKPVDALRYE